MDWESIWGRMGRIIDLDTMQRLERRTPPSMNSAYSNEIDNHDYLSIEYRLESARLASYENWSVPYLDPAELAAAGLFYTGVADRVKCFECGVEIMEWVEGDNPMSDHQRWRPICKFVRKLPCGNVQIGVDPDTVPISISRSRDVYGRYREDYRPNASPDFRMEQAEFQFPSTARLGRLGLAKPKGAVHPEYAGYESRLKTFNNWPTSIPQTKEQLADAGFYYTGRGDMTQCYHCGGGLKNWELKGDPWEQHAKWLTKCYYVLIVKGQSFFDKMSGQRVAPLTREEMLQMNLPASIEKVKQQPAENNSEIEFDEEVNPEVASTLPSDSPSKGKNSDDGRMCKICYNEELGIVFLPCQHMVACVKCAPDMRVCAVCREEVTVTVRAIIS